MAESQQEDAFVRFECVHKSYDGRTFAVQNINLTVSRGEFLTLLGPSGCGKTTCLMMLAGFEPVTRGRILLDGITMDKIPPHKRGIGMVFQNYALFPHMTVAENLSFPLKMHGNTRKAGRKHKEQNRRTSRMSKAERERKVSEALDMVQMGGFGSRRPAQLSGGQQQRIALARALVFKPRLVLMDEPLGALDKQLREQMQLEVSTLARQLGIAVIYVTHDQTEALSMSDRIAVLNAGRIQQTATPSELYESPQNGFVARFVGENNMLPGTVKEIAGGRALVQLEDGCLIACMAGNVCRCGESTAVSVRPERVAVATPSVKPGCGINRLKAEVMESVYLGDMFRTRLRVAGREDFVIKFHNAPGQARLQRGEQIEISWRAEDCRALDS